MKISDLYRDIANNPKYQDTQELRKITKTLLNRARVRVQTIENRGAQSGRYMVAKKRLQDAGLLTGGGNVSTGLPKTDRQKILTALRSVTNFLDVADTTIKGQKRRKREAAQKAKRKKEAEKKKREKERLKKKKEKQKREKQKKEKETEKREDNDEEKETDEKEIVDEIKEEIADDVVEVAEEGDEDDGATMGDYWQIARDAGLFESIPYDDFVEYIEDIYDNINISDFEEIVINAVESGADFWSDISSYGVDIDD